MGADQSIVLAAISAGAVAHLLLVGRLDVAPGSAAALLRTLSLIAALAVAALGAEFVAGPAVAIVVLVALAPLLRSAGPVLPAREVLAATEAMDPWVEALEGRWELVQLRERARAARF